MNIYQNNQITVHTLESKDIEDCIMLYSQEKFGFVENQSMALEEEYQTMKKVVEKKTNATQYIVLEEQNKLLGYAKISKQKKDMYYLNYIRIQPYLMSEKYGMLLLDIIKQEAIQDNCSIECNNQDEEENMLIRAGFYKNIENSFYLSNKEVNSSIGKILLPIFDNYKYIDQENNQNQDRPKIKNKKA